MIGPESVQRQTLGAGGTTGPQPRLKTSIRLIAHMLDTFGVIAHQT